MWKPGGVSLQEMAEMQDEEMKDIAPIEGCSGAEGGAEDDAEGSGYGDLSAARGHTAAIAQQLAGGGHTHVAEHEGIVTDGEGAFAGVLIDGFRVPEVCCMSSQSAASSQVLMLSPLSVYVCKQMG